MHYTTFDLCSEETIAAIENIKNDNPIVLPIRHWDTGLSTDYWHPEFFKLMIDHNAEKFIDIYAKYLVNYCVYNRDLERFKKLLTRERLIIKYNAFYDVICKIDYSVNENIILIDPVSEEPTSINKHHFNTCECDYCKYFTNEKILEIKEDLSLDFGEFQFKHYSHHFMKYQNYLLKYETSYNKIDKEYYEFIFTIIFEYTTTYFNIMKKASLMNPTELDYYYHLNRKMTNKNYYWNMIWCLNILAKSYNEHYNLDCYKHLFTFVFNSYYTVIGFGLPENIRDRPLYEKNIYKRNILQDILNKNELRENSVLGILGEQNDNVLPTRYQKIKDHSVSKFTSSIEYYSLIMVLFYNGLTLDDIDLPEITTNLIKLIPNMLRDIPKSSEYFYKIITYLMKKGYSINDRSFKDTKYTNINDYIRDNCLSYINNYLIKLDYEDSYRIYKNYSGLDKYKDFYRTIVLRTAKINNTKLFKDTFNTKYITSNHTGFIDSIIQNICLNNNYELFKYFIKLINKDNKEYFNNIKNNQRYIDYYIKICIYKKAYDIIRYITNKTNIKYNTTEALRYASATNDYEITQFLLKSFKYKTDMTAIILAESEIRELLLEYMEADNNNLLLNLNELTYKYENKNTMDIRIQYPVHIDYDSSCICLSNNCICCTEADLNTYLNRTIIPER